MYIDIISILIYILINVMKSQLDWSDAENNIANKPIIAFCLQLIDANNYPR